MDRLRKVLLTTCEKLKGFEKGQDMAEYVLIMAAVGVAGYTAYVGLEGGINGLITTVTGLLKGA